MNEGTERKGREKKVGEGQPRDPGEELNALCDSYFEHCDKNGRRYTVPGLLLWLNISEETFHGWRDNKNHKHKQASEAMERAVLRMQDDLEQRSDTMSVFRLKQPCYGGYGDRPREDNGQEIKVKVSFGGHDGKAAMEYGK